jgi:hypothetical protein
MRHTTRLLAYACAAPLLAACVEPTSDLGGPGGPGDPVGRVVVSPASHALEVGETVQLQASVYSTTGSPLDRAVAWSSSDEAVLTVSAAGVASGRAAGSAFAIAAAEGVSDTAAVTVNATPPPPPSAVLVGAGDIGKCGTSKPEATAKLLDGIAGTVIAIGDNAYNDGTLTEYNQCYDPNWGRHKARTRPVPGNHEYHTSGAQGYFDYFGALAGDRAKGYYSYDVGPWHVIALNSNIELTSGSPQLQWLRADLAANPRPCTLAYWHHPRFSSGYHGNNSAMQPFWDALYEGGADVVLNGHDHNYERFAPQSPTGAADAGRGIREFVVGTGGTGLRSFSTVRANSEVRITGEHGVLKLELEASGYRWSFVTEPDGAVQDSGTGACH